MNSEWAEQPRSQGNLAALGAQLKTAREAMGWSVEHVSDQLKLAPRQVVALEEGDTGNLPNMAVVRGFIRAYAKILKIDAAPMVANIEVNPVAGDPSAPPRREISASFSEARFPLMSKRAPKRTGWIVGALVVAALAAAGAYQMGFIRAPALAQGGIDSTHVSSAVSAPTLAGATPAPAPQPAPGATTAKPAPDTTLQSPSVPLISVPPPPADSTVDPAGATAGTAPATASATPAATPAAAATPVPAATAPAADTAAAASGDNALVLTVTEDSWITIRRSRGGSTVVSRMVTAGSTESFDITEPVQLVVGKPDGVQATLRGKALPLPRAPGGTTSRLNIK
jgi:cytoskeleton protein RodZ